MLATRTYATKLKKRVFTWDDRSGEGLCGLFALAGLLNLSWVGKLYWDLRISRWNGRVALSWLLDVLWKRGSFKLDNLGLGRLGGCVGDAFGILRTMSQQVPNPDKRQIAQPSHLKTWRNV